MKRASTSTVYYFVFGTKFYKFKYNVYTTRLSKAPPRLHCRRDIDPGVDRRL
jgi:hypothetical protein